MDIVDKAAPAGAPAGVESLIRESGTPGQDEPQAGEQEGEHLDPRQPVQQQSRHSEGAEEYNRWSDWNQESLHGGAVVPPKPDGSTKPPLP